MRRKKLIKPRELGWRRNTTADSGIIVEFNPLRRSPAQRHQSWLQEKRAAYNTATDGSCSWSIRRQAILDIAKRYNGVIRIQHVASECNVSISTAALWLHRLLLEGLISVIAWQRNRAIYALKEVGPGHIGE